MSRIQQSGWGQYNGSTELVVRLNEGPCGFDGGLKLKKSLYRELWMSSRMIKESLLWLVCFKEVIKTITLVISKSLYHFELLHEICFVQYNGISAAYTLEISQSCTNSYIQYTFSITLKIFLLEYHFFLFICHWTYHMTNLSSFIFSKHLLFGTYAMQSQQNIPNKIANKYKTVIKYSYIVIIFPG